ncbi:TPA: 4Fe-4S dicluster domain-containing protein [Candidatus Poribacteria bacterium]|nr:4Fe-4S dicluster domain-containing protein [Candidatus Poribacteria bacterium]
MTEIDLSFIDKIVEKIGRGPEAVIPILQAIQEHYRYLPDEVLQHVCEITQITPAQITGVSTFYSQFRHQPVGKHIINVCHGTACHVKGASSVDDAFRRHLGVSGDDDTDADGLFTIQKVACLGCCTLAPVVQIDLVTYGHLTSEVVPRVLRDFLELQKRDAPQQKREYVIGKQGDYAEIRVGLGSCCVARGSGKVYDAMRQALIDTGVQAVVKRVGCVGMCHQTPLVEVVPPNGPSFLYARVQSADAKQIVLRHFKPKGMARKISYSVSKALENILTDEAWEPVARYSIEVRDPPVAAFLGRQKHIATEHSGHINPTDLEEYLQHDGFKALNRCVNELTPEQLIEEIQNSGLRGRGGAGFPTGMKWSMVRQASEFGIEKSVVSHSEPIVGQVDGISAGERLLKSELKYVICNGDEGDPGAFMDRMLLESYPYRIIEGIAIAAYAVGANEGIFYIRAEYPLALQRVREALSRCEEQGFLGNDILGSGFSLHLRIMEGAGAFVCGEESALLASIEGRRGMPKLRPPYPAESGLYGKPTLVNNVETYALVPWIIRNGADAFAALGTEKSKGTKVFALAGKIARGGLIEVPMGISIREIVEEIGGGVGSDKRFKAVQVGGPSGGCVPAELAHTPVDYEALTAVGAIMGSGGLVVLDDSDCMVEISRYFLEFTQDQSCGKCTYCRIGTRRMLDMLNRLCEGQGKKGDLEELEQLALTVKQGSLCGLGKTAPNPVLSTLKYFRDEYEAHLEKRCPAGKCKALIRYSVTDYCIGCTLCAQHCPTEAIAMTPYQKHEIDADRCLRCGTCKEVCPVDAIIVCS